MDELYDDFFEKTDYLTETKGLLKDRINSLGGSITSGTTFRDYLVWLDSLYEALEEKTITGLPDSLEGKCEQDGTPTPSSPVPINITTGRQVVSVCGKNLFNNVLNSSINLARATITYEDNQIVMNTTGADAYIGNIVNAGGSWDITKGQLIPVEANTQYYLYITNNVINKNFITYYDENLTSIQVLFNVSNSQQFTTPANAKYMSFRIGNGNSTSGGIYKFNVMVGKGNISTTYEEYKGNDYEINLGKNLFNKDNITSINNGTLSNDIITSNAISSDYSGVSANITNFKLQTGTYYVSMKVKLESGTVRNNLNTITISSSPSITKTIISNPNLSNEYQIYSASIVCSSETSITSIGIQLKNQNSNAVISYKDIMVSKDNNTSYSPYKTPIYLGKIGTYQDYIVKTSGKNLFDKDSCVLGKVWNGSNNTKRAYGYIEAVQGQRYTVSCQNNNSDLTVYYVETTTVGTSGTNIRQVPVAPTLSFTPQTNTKYIVIQFATTNNDITQEMINNANVMIEYGNQATYYEPYGEGQWYIHKEVGRVVYDGSDDEAWSYLNNYDDNYLYQSLGISVDIENYSTNYLCSHALPNSTSSSSGNIGSYVFNKAFRLRVPSSIATTSGAFKTWLSSNNVEVYYVLNTPTNTLIEDEELINQLNEIEIFTVISEDFYN